MRHGGSEAIIMRTFFPHEGFKVSQEQAHSVGFLESH